MNSKGNLQVAAGSAWRGKGKYKQNFWTNAYKMLQLLFFCYVSECLSMLCLVSFSKDCVLCCLKLGKAEGDVARSFFSSCIHSLDKISGKLAKGGLAVSWVGAQQCSCKLKQSVIFSRSCCR